MFGIKKLDKCILDKMDKELVMLEIKNLHSTTNVIARIIFGYILFTIGYIFGMPKTDMNFIAGFAMLFVFLILLVYSNVVGKNIKEYEQELFNIAADKSKKEKEQNENN